MAVIAETTTESIQYAVEQTKEAIMPAFYTIVQYALILAIIGIIFLFIKFMIIKAIKNKKDASDTPKQKSYNDEGREYYLDNDELEAIRLYSKLSDNEKQNIKQEMKELIRK